MKEQSNYTRQIRNLLVKSGMIRARDLKELNIPRMYLSRLLIQGDIERIARGLYVLADHEPTENHTIAQVARKVPEGVVCLLSALQFHGLTTQLPHQVWIAIDYKARKPHIPELPIRIFRYSKSALTEGYKIHKIENVEVRIYEQAKTVADCFKYRNKIGLDVALEALADCRRQNKCTNDELWKYAKICRVSNIMRPYMEAIGYGHRRAKKSRQI